MHRSTWGAGKLACALTMLVGATGCAATHHNPLPTAKGAPRYRATLNDWDLLPSPSSNMFEFNPPAGATRLDILPANGGGE